MEHGAGQVLSHSGTSSIFPHLLQGQVTSITCARPPYGEALAELSDQAASFPGFPKVLGSGSVGDNLSISLVQPDPA